MDLKISFGPFAPEMSDLVFSVSEDRDDGIEDARAAAEKAAAENFPITLQYTIHNSKGVTLGRWDFEEGRWIQSRLHRVA